MTTLECTREQEILDALATAQWPEHAGDDLRDHVATCTICADLVEVAGPLIAERGQISEEAHIPSSAVMWWRAQMRARQEAAREAARPMTVAHTVAATAGLALACGVLYSMAPWLRQWISSLPGLPHFDLPAVLADGPMVPTIVIVIAGVMLVLMPVAVYFAVREDRG